MTLKPLAFATAVALSGLGIAPLLAVQAPKTQFPAANGTDHSQRLIGVEMPSHPSAIATLALKLDESFRAISEARDVKGYVKNNAALKEHEANIRALRDGVRHHRFVISDDEYQCGASGQQDAVFQCQKEVKGVVHDVIESFNAFEQTNDEPDNPSIVVTMNIGPAYVAHREALKKLADMIAQHEPAMAPVMKAYF